jgi:DNA-binding transcriptional LysR family regulator
MSLKIESLYCFSVIAESDSFSQAAERLFITQQALSKILSQLEKDLGQPLIYRNQRGRQRLTPAGEFLRKDCYYLLNSIYDLEHLFGQPSAPPKRANIRISSIFALEEKIAALLRKWGERDHEIAPGFYNCHSIAQLEHDLLSGSLDLGILPQPPVSPDLAFVLMRSIPYIIVGAEHIQGRWDQLSYLAFVPIPDQGGVLNVWPEERWPRKIVGEANAFMAAHLCAQGVACLHIPRTFYPLGVGSTPLDAAMHIVTEPPFEAFYHRYLIWPNRPQAQHIETLKQEILSVMGVVH